MTTENETMTETATETQATTPDVPVMAAAETTETPEAAPQAVPPEVTVPETPKRKRGRPPGSKNKPKTEKKARKAKSAKSAKKSTHPSMTGQAGPPIDLSLADLNTKEKHVLNALNVDRRKPMTIAELAEAAFKPLGNKVKRNSWTRNSLRRLTRGGLVEATEVQVVSEKSGKELTKSAYRMTASGKGRLERAGMPKRPKTVTPVVQTEASAEAAQEQTEQPVVAADPAALPVE